MLAEAPTGDGRWVSSARAGCQAWLSLGWGQQGRRAAPALPRDVSGHRCLRGGRAARGLFMTPSPSWRRGRSGLSPAAAAAAGPRSGDREQRRRCQARGGASAGWEWNCGWAPHLLSLLLLPGCPAGRDSSAKTVSPASGSRARSAELPAGPRRGARTQADWREEVSRSWREGMTTRAEWEGPVLVGKWLRPGKLKGLFPKRRRKRGGELP